VAGARLRLNHPRFTYGRPQAAVFESSSVREGEKLKINVKGAGGTPVVQTPTAQTFSTLSL
jgi:hypothetical protein